MKIYLVEVLEDPVLLVINISYQYLIITQLYYSIISITQISHAFANLGLRMYR